MFNLRSLDLNLLTVFEAIYELGTVSDAADRLALSQPAASHALSRLREACKDDLFVRARQGLSPTPVAKAMYPPIKEALETLRASLAEASAFDPARSRRHFQISIPHPLGAFYALDIKMAAARAAPGIVLTFDIVSEPIDLEIRLRDGKVDIAIDWLPVELDPFVNRRLFEDHLILIARKDHPSVKPGVTIDDLRKEEFVLPHSRHDLEHLPRALGDFRRLELPEAVRISELLEIPTLVATTDLVGMFPLSMRQLLEERMGLQVIPFPLELAPVPIYMIWHEARCKEAAHAWLRELVAGRFELLARRRF